MPSAGIWRHSRVGRAAEDPPEFSYIRWMGGRLIAWTVERASASGLEDIAHGELVEVDGSGPALVTASLGDRVELAPLSARTPSLGAEVRPRGPLATHAGEQLIGRIVDCLGRPLDGREVVCDDREPIFGRDPVVFSSVSRRLTLGALVYDLQRLVGTGISMLAVGRREVLRHVLRHQVASGRVVVVATPAATSAAHLDVLRGARSGPPSAPVEEPVRGIHVAARSDATPAEQWLVPWTAMAIASSLRARGRDVVVAIDHLDAWRPHVRSFASRGSWGTQLAQLASRAYSRPDGSVSLIALTSKLSVTRAAAFDDVLDLSLAARGEIPDSGTKVVRPPIRVPSVKRLAGACVAARRLAELEAHGHPHERIEQTQRLELDAALRQRACLRVHSASPIDSLEQELCLLAVAALPNVPLHAVTDFTVAYLVRLRRDHADTLAEIRAAQRMNAAEEQALLKCAADVATTLRSGPETRP